MKRINSIILLMLISVSSILINCEEKEPSVDVCGTDVTIKKKIVELSAGIYSTSTHYYLAFDPDKFDGNHTYSFEATATWKPNASASELPVVTQSLDFVIYTTGGKYELEYYLNGDVLFVHYVADVENEKPVVFPFYNDERLYLNFVGSKEYNYPIITLTLLSSDTCPEEKKELKDEDIEVDNDAFLDSIIIPDGEGIKVGETLSISLYSNNEGDVAPSIEVTSDLGDTENIELTLEDGVANGTLATQASSTAGTSNDGILNLQSGSNITITYDKNLNEEGTEEPLSISFEASAADPTCDDGIMNGEETAIDCGGPDCDACPTFNDFLNIKVILAKSVQEDSNGNEISVSFTNEPGDPCYGNYYELFKDDNTVDNYVNSDFNDVDCSATEIQFSQNWSLTGSTLTISGTDGSSPTDWTLEITSATTFNLSTPHPNGTDFQVWYYVKFQ